MLGTKWERQEDIVGFVYLFEFCEIKYSENNVLKHRNTLLDYDKPSVMQTQQRHMSQLTLNITS